MRRRMRHRSFPGLLPYSYSPSLSPPPPFFFPLPKMGGRGGVMMSKRKGWRTNLDYQNPYSRTLSLDLACFLFSLFSSLGYGLSVTFFVPFLLSPSPPPFFFFSTLKREGCSKGTSGNGARRRLEPHRLPLGPFPPFPSPPSSPPFFFFLPLFLTEIVKRGEMDRGKESSEEISLTVGPTPRVPHVLPFSPLFFPLSFSFFFFFPLPEGITWGWDGRAFSLSFFSFPSLPSFFFSFF